MCDGLLSPLTDGEPSPKFHVKLTISPVEVFWKLIGSPTEKIPQKSLFKELKLKSGTPNSDNTIGSRGNSIGGHPLDIPY